MAGKMSEAEIKSALGGVDGWAQEGEAAITKKFTFADHITAMGFCVRVAMAAEVMDHHPAMRIVYNMVDFRLNTHSAGGVTEKDFALAKKINELAGA